MSAFKKSAWVFLLNTVSSWNWLVPVGIVVVRYFMVCHAVFCHNHGGERSALRAVMMSMVVIALFSGSSVVYYHKSHRTYLVCIGKEEQFR